METLNFSDVAQLVNRIGTIAIPVHPSSEEKGQWSLHESSVQFGGIKSDLRILYLFADANLTGTKRAKALCKPSLKSITQVIYADSLLTRNRSLIEGYRENTASALSLTEYFSSFIRNQTENYITKIKTLDFKDFVQPKITVSETITKRFPNPAMSFLLDPEQSEARFNGTLGILLGEPGQGKTFMSRYLADSCARRNRIPIYVHSEQWSRMQLDDTASLWKTIVHSFRYFDSPIGWIEGAEEQFLRVALQTGLFRVIFDGFDEFVLWNKGSVNALETIRNLQSLSEATGTRILLSSRNSFWDSEIATKIGTKDRPQHTFRIEPFDENSANQYFRLRLSTIGDQTEAGKIFLQLAKKVQSKSTDFIGRGFFLYLIADLVNRGFTSTTFQLSKITVFQWMIDALCEREERRQTLPIDAHQQIEAINNFAEFLLRDELPNDQTLSLVVQATSTLSETEANELVGPKGKLKDHPIIKRDTQGRWAFVQEQIYFNLLAAILIRYCTNTSLFTSLNTIVQSKQLTSTRLQADVAAATVEQVLETAEISEREQSASLIIGALLKSSLRIRFISLEGAKNSAALATSIAQLTVNHLLPTGSSHQERLNQLVALLPGGALRSLRFSGSISKFDLSRAEFSQCTFSQVAWANCTFSAETTFSDCEFIGGSMTSCTDFGQATIATNCVLDSEAREMIDAALIYSGKKVYSKDNLRIDIIQLVQKFIFKDGLGIKTIEEHSLERGPISNSIFRKEIVSAFKRLVVDSHSLAAGRIGFSVKEDVKPAFHYFSANGVLTGALATLSEELIAVLSI